MDDPVLRALFLLDYTKPLLLGLQLLLTLCVGIFALRAPRTPALLLISIACFVTVIITAVYLIGNLQTEWKIVLFRVEARRVLFVMAYSLQIVETLIWPTALVLLIRERRASVPPTI